MKKQDRGPAAPYPAICSQCGQTWRQRACGPTHALIWHEIRTGRASANAAWFATEDEPVCGSQKPSDTLRCYRAKGHDGRHSAINHDAPDTSTDWTAGSASASEPPAEEGT